MAERQFVVFGLAKEEYGIEISWVKEIVRFQEVTKIPEAPAFVKGIINLRGEVIPIVDLKLRYYRQESEITDNTRIVVMKMGEQTVGIIADEVSEVLSIPEEAIEATPGILMEFNNNGIAGVGKVDNRLLILLKVEQILAKEEIKAIEEMDKVVG